MGFPLNLDCETGEEIGRTKRGDCSLYVVVANAGDDGFISGGIAFCCFRGGFEQS